jgi:hypothetical protein
MIWKTLTVLFCILSIAMILETNRVFTSTEKDIVDHRATILPTTTGLLLVFVVLAIYCWRKTKKL